LKKTRPTRDAVRETFFNLLGPDIEGSSFLDLFAGSGAMGIEALSRGARMAVFVDAHPAPVEAIRRNLRCCDIENGFHVIKSRVLPFLRSGPKKTWEAFDFVFADPPYDDYSLENLRKMLGFLRRGWIREDSTFALERPEGSFAWLEEEAEDLSVRASGRARLAIARLQPLPGPLV